MSLRKHGGQDDQRDSRLEGALCKMWSDMNSFLQQTDLAFKWRKSSGGEVAVPFTLALDKCFISLIFQLSSFMRLNFVLFTDSSQVMCTTHLSSESQPKRFYTDIVSYVTFLRDTTATAITYSMYSKHRHFFNLKKKEEEENQHYGLFYFLPSFSDKGRLREPFPLLHLSFTLA